MDSQNIRIRLQAFDHRVLECSTREIVNTAQRTGARRMVIWRRWRLVQADAATHAGCDPADLLRVGLTRWGNRVPRPSIAVKSPSFVSSRNPAFRLPLSVP